MVLRWKMRLNPADNRWQVYRIRNGKIRIFGAYSSEYEAAMTMITLNRKVMTDE